MSYVTSLPQDVFDPGNDPINQAGPHTYHYVCDNDTLNPNEAFFFHGANPERLHIHWILQSYGPDLGKDGGQSNTYWQWPRYDATNGTVSIGNILRTGP